MTEDGPNMPQVGQAVRVVTETGVRCVGLITAVWNENCINAVIITPDESKTDSYGRQTERYSSLTRKNPQQTAHGRYWQFLP